MKGWRSRPIPHCGSHATQLGQHLVVIVIPVTAFPGPPRPVPTSANTTYNLKQQQQQTNRQHRRRAPSLSAYQSCARGRTHNDLAPRGCHPRDNACTGRAYTRYRGTCGCGLLPREATRQSNARVHRPSAAVAHSRIVNQNVPLSISGGGEHTS